MGGAIIQTRRFRSGPLDIEILRTNILLSLHANPRHLVGGPDPLPVGVPVNLGVANAEGAAVNFARRDHVHNHPAALGFALHHDHYHRMLECAFTASNDDLGQDEYCLLVPLIVPYLMTVDRIGWINTTPSAGNMRACLYMDNGDIPQGGALIVESASVASPGANRKMEVTIADTQLTPALYWIAMQTSAWDDEIANNIDDQSLGGTLQGYGFDIAYAAFPDPCPVVAVEAFVWWAYVRVKSVP